MAPFPTSSPGPNTSTSTPPNPDTNPTSQTPTSQEDPGLADPYSPFPTELEGGSADYSPYPGYRERDAQGQGMTVGRQKTFGGIGNLGGSVSGLKSGTESVRQESDQSGDRQDESTDGSKSGTGTGMDSGSGSSSSATFPLRARAGRRTKTVQELWFGGVVKDETLIEPVDEGEDEAEQDKPDEKKEGGDDDNDNADQVDPDEVVVQDGDRPLTLSWARSITTLVSTSSGVSIDVQLVRPHTPIPKEEIREVPLVPGLTAGAEQQQQQQERRRGLEQFGGEGKGEWRFLFRFRGSYAKVLFAKSALRREITPEVSFRCQCIARSCGSSLLIEIGH
jgi:hypothetical protein